MTFQRFVRTHGDALTWIAAALIAAAFTMRLANVGAGDDIGMMAASVIGFAPVAIRAYQALRVKVVSIELLVSIAVVGAFAIGQFDESAIVTFLFNFGGFLEKKTLEKTRSSIKELTRMAPTMALREDGSEIDIEMVAVGEKLLVKTGARVPVDGVVTAGQGYADEASVTGESRPVHKTAGDAVYAGTMLSDGTLHVTTQRVGEDTTFGKIINLVEQAQDTKSPAERFIDRFARWYTPAVLVLALGVGLITWDAPLAITILVLGCPGALVIGAPVSNVAGIGNGATHGVLVKGGEVMSVFSRVDTLMFDKTGTLTLGNTEVGAVKDYGATPDTWAALAGIERESDHPLARAIVRFVDRRADGLTPAPVQHSHVVTGQGVTATVDGHAMVVGNEKLLADAGIALHGRVRADLAEIQSSGASTVLVARDGQVRIVIGIADQPRPGIPEALARLRRMGVTRMIMLTGDNAHTARAVATSLGIDEVHAELLPQDKSDIVTAVKAAGGRVAFIGDGINDSPSLAMADIGIAMGSGTDVAVETSDIVLMRSHFDELVHAYGLAKRTVLNVKENIVIAIAVVAFLLAGLIFGYIYMASGMLVHEVSILVVIVNAMRLLRYRSKK